jgi:large subunit ribosomal protein L25
MRLRRSSQINLFIPIDFVNEDIAPGIKQGGVLTIVRPEIELIVTAGDIPEKIEIDLSALNIGDVITISSVSLPEGAKPTIDRDFVIANISAPSGLAAAADEEETTSEEEATEEVQEEE